MAQVLESFSPTPHLTSGMTALEQRLQSSPYWSLRQLICDEDQNGLIVRGTVPSYYLKQLAQTLVAKAVGIECVRSEIAVESEQIGLKE